MSSQLLRTIESSRGRRRSRWILLGAPVGLGLCLIVGWLLWVALVRPPGEADLRLRAARGLPPPAATPIESSAFMTVGSQLNVTGEVSDFREYQAAGGLGRFDFLLWLEGGGILIVQGSYRQKEFSSQRKSGTLPLFPESQVEVTGTIREFSGPAAHLPGNRRTRRYLELEELRIQH